MIDRAGKLNHFFKPAVSNLELVMRDAFATGAVATRSADAQHPAIERDLNVLGANPGQINFHDPALVCAIDVGRRDPQTARWPLVTRALDQTKVTLKRFAGHNDSSAEKSSKVKRKFDVQIIRVCSANW